MIPRTPTKANDEITEITNSLAARWRLQFPARDGTYSPSKIKDPSRPEEQVMNCLRFLVFKDPEGLKIALKRFEKHAETVFSQWKFKPHADQDVIPRRLPAESSLQRDISLRRSEITETTADELMKSLLHNLISAAEHVKQTQRNSSSEIFDDQKYIAKLDPRATIPLNAKPELSRTKLATSTVLRPHRSVELSGQHPSTDEFDPDVEDYGMMADVFTPQKPVFGSKIFPGAKESSIEDEEIFTTPPTTPPTSEEKNSNSDFLRQPDLVNHPQLSSLSKKRSYEESMKPPLARKVSRGRYETHHSVPEERPISPVELHPSNSFDSVTSLGTTAMTGSLSSWTRSTSFHSNSITTSFNSSVDTTDRSDNFIHDRHLQTTRHEAKNMEVKRFVNANYDIEEYELMDIDDLNTEALANYTYDDSQVSSIKGKSLDHNSVEHGKSSNRKDAFLVEQFVSSTLLIPLNSQKRCAVPFRQLYEVTRVSMATKLPLDVFCTCLNHTYEGYDKLWSSLRSIVKAHDKSLPERCSLMAWERASNHYDGVSLTGDLKYTDQPGAPIFEFELKAMKVEKSYRLARKFGGDRFCVVSMPGVSYENLPGHLKSNHAAVRESIVRRLVDTELCFLGRIWRAFYLKPEAKKPRRGKQNGFNETKFRLYYFAIDGHDFRNPSLTGEVDPRGNDHAPISIEKLVDWFMPAKNNLGQTCLKFFTRLALGVSNNTPTVVFYSNEIIRTRDARARNPEVRRVKKLPNVENPVIPGNPVMNDGCARISKAAAQSIADMLCLGQTPSVFQGRIAGAKGIWMVDILDESLPSCNREFWIEITDSQLKFEGHAVDDIYPDDNRVTFEVNSYSKKLLASTLNFQLMPILANRGVPEEVFSRLLKEDLMEKIGVLEGAMESGLALGKWNQDTNPVAGERAYRNQIEMIGGIPLSTPEKINWFVEHGFEPKYCRELKDVLFKAVKDYYFRLEKKMNIEVGKSTSALMIADPLAILEPNEIQLCFSSKFQDPKSRWEDVMLHDTDVLVARLPALLPSDIQKVRAVFKTELRRYTDVVIFSSKGTCSLASKLSGGDYDGDRAWICWEPSIVDPFQNVSVPESPSLEFYGIKVDNVKVSDLLPRPDFTSAFLHHGFSFNLQPSMLGYGSTYHESLCYSQTSVDDPKAVYIGILLGLLVDRAKAGIIFDEDQWQAFLKEQKLPLRLSKPAYKNKEKGKPTSHLLDKLVFEIAKGVREKKLGDFSRHFAHVASWDEDLVRIYNSETELAKKDQVLASVLDDLKVKLVKIVDFWCRNIRFIDDDEFQSTRKPMALSFSAVVEKCRADFVAISPCDAPGVDESHLGWRWNRSSGNQANSGANKYWSWLKASVFFAQQKNHERAMVWYVAGVELGEMKAMARGTGTYRVVKREVHHVMKLNGKLVGGFQRDGKLEADEAAEDEEDEYGVWGWD